METTSIIFNILFAGLLIWLIITIIKHPKAFFVDIPLGFLKRLIGWDLFEDLFSKNNNDPDFKYESETKKNIDFENFSKYILLDSQKNDLIQKILIEGLEIIDVPIDQFDHEIKRIDNFLILAIKSKIGFFNFHVLIQNFYTNKIENTGFVEDKELSFVVYQDPNSLNNMIGETNKGERFSVSLYDGFEKGAYLSMNSKIRIDQKRRFKIVKRKITAGNKV
jgi:hypothetical protein